MSAKNRRIRRFLAAAGLSLGLAATGLSAAGEHAHTHDHDHGAVPARLELDDGRKWPTDEPLRRGMENIRNAMDAALRGAREDRLSAARYDELAGKVSGEVGRIVAACKLDPKADAQLHLIIADILEGVEAMEGKAGKSGREGGAAKVADALEKYGAHFDHPNWRLLGH